MKKREKILKVTKKCPKCGNVDGLICLPGAGMTYYFCPACDKKKKETQDNG